MMGGRRHSTAPRVQQPWVDGTTAHGRLAPQLMGGCYQHIPVAWRGGMIGGAHDAGGQHDDDDGDDDDDDDGDGDGSRVGMIVLGGMHDWRGGMIGGP
mmetsp:Transcript_8343/g.22273  ORF Transcript_8343/g.22273 Transcript_8343/m.22273 type:complete len:98 (+) Transcript_8343:650-943(+)